MKKGIFKNNEKQIDRLKKAIISGNIFHAVIFAGKESDTSEIVSWFTAAALCESGSGEPCGSCISCRRIKDGNSEEIVKVSSDDGKDGEKGTGRIKDRQIEELISRSIKNSLGADKIFMIIENAGSMTPRAQNRLLKTLEEPPEGIVIILLCENEQSLLETIRSRCQIIRLADEGTELSEIAKKAFLKRTAETDAALLCGAPLYELWKNLEYFASTREYALKFTELSQLFVRDVILSDQPGCEGMLHFKDYSGEIERCRGRAPEEKMFEIMETVKRAYRDLDMNVSMKHSVRYMALDIQRILEQ